MESRTWRPCQLPPVLFLLLSCIGPVLGQPVINITNGQQLADAVATWAVSGQNTVLQLMVPVISMKGVNFTTPAPANGREPYSSGQLTIAAASGQFSVLDGAMRGGLIPPLKGATLLLKSVGILNSCESSQPSRNSSDGGLFFFSLLYVSTFTENCTFYVWPSEVARVVYLPAMYRTPFKELRQVAGPPVQEPLGSLKLAWITKQAALMKNISRSFIHGIDLTVRSYADPDDPVLQSIRAQGLLMPPQYCNGTLFPAWKAQARIDPLLPLAYATSSAQLTQAFDDIPGIVNTKGLPWKPPPIILLNGSVSLAPDLKATLDYLVLMTGPGILDWDYPSSAALDLSGTQDSLRLGPAGKLFIQAMVLTGLAQLPLPSSPSIQSALPLAAITPAAGRSAAALQQHVWMHSVTLVLPQDDYLALMSLALEGSSQSISSCIGPDVRQLVAILQPGIQVLVVSQLAPDWQQLSLASFVGWGINATSGLTLASATPINLGSACWPQPSHGRCGRWPCARLIGVVVGVGVVLGILALILIMRHCKKQKHAQLQNKTDHGLILKLVERKPVFDSTEQRTLSEEAALMSSRVGTEVMDTFASRLSVLMEEQRHSCGPQTLEGTSFRGGGEEAPADGGLLQAFDQDLEEIRRRAAMLNDVADRVTVSRLLGKGSSGCVFEGIWRGLPVALKTVVFEEREPAGSQATGMPAASKRAIMEAAIACSVGHPNVVACYTYDIKPVMPVESKHADSGLQVDMMLDEASQAAHAESCTYKLFLVQELCTASLSTVLSNLVFFDDRTGVMDWNSLMCLMLDVARGLAYLHSKGIIHGDLKTDNVMLKAVHEPQCYVVAKLTDFGLSAHLPGDATHVSDFRCGTPFYVAPEVVTHAKASTASDMYGFGIILWECASSRSIAVRGADGGAVWNPVFPYFQEHLCPPKHYVHLMQWCLDHNPSDRPTAAEAVELLGRILMSIRDDLKQTPVQVV